MGITVKSNDEVTEACFEDGQCVLKLKSGEQVKESNFNILLTFNTLIILCTVKPLDNLMYVQIAADYIVVAVGIKANTELAESSGLEVDPEHGGFRVNAEMQARSDVYVVRFISRIKTKYKYK